MTTLLYAEHSGFIQNGFEKCFQWGAGEATFEQMLCLLLYWTEREYNFNVSKGSLSWTDNIHPVIVFVCYMNHRL